MGKTIFLDIDGVLALNHRERDDYGSLFHEQFVNNLKSIILETSAKIVISSTWRMSGLKVMQEMWVHRGLPGEVIAVTPSFRRTFTKEPYYYTIPRGCEIEWWLKEEGLFQRINWSKETQQEYLDKAIVKNYVILDDDSDMLYGQREHFVRCSNRFNEPDAQEGYGLTAAAAASAIEILNSSIIDLYYP